MSKSSPAYIEPSLWVRVPADPCSGALRCLLLGGTPPPAAEAGASPPATGSAAEVGDSPAAA